MPHGKDKPSSSAVLDLSAIGISGLCLAHCILLPVAFAALPLAGQVAENHVVHQILVMIAAPVSIWALSRSGGWKKPLVVALALTGFGFLIAGAYVRALETHETLLTITGALIIAAAHAMNWRNPRHRNGQMT